TTATYAPSLHDALPILVQEENGDEKAAIEPGILPALAAHELLRHAVEKLDDNLQESLGPPGPLLEAPPGEEIDQAQQERHRHPCGHNGGGDHHGPNTEDLVAENVRNDVL